MTQPIRIHSRVAADGVLKIEVPLGPDEAGSDVIVTVQKANAAASQEPSDRAEWHRFIEETYGSCAGMGLERHDQGTLEERDPIE